MTIFFKYLFNFIIIIVRIVIGAFCFPLLFFHLKRKKFISLVLHYILQQQKRIKSTVYDESIKVTH